MIAAISELSISEALLEVAFTHKSYAGENPPAADNERLEFLGDAVIELAYTDHLYRTNPHKSEGRLSVERAMAVSEPALALLARKLQLGSYMRLGRGEEISGGRNRDSLLADAFEALVGALYLEHGWERARQFVVAQLQGLSLPVSIDNKGRLQELLQAASQQIPSYKVLSASGPDHAKVFTVEVIHQGQSLGQGVGHTKKEAEQEAAAMALHHLQPPAD